MGFFEKLFNPNSLSEDKTAYGSGDKTIRIVPHDKCTGCGACYNGCPAKAISMEYDGDGFVYPIVSDETCIGCGKCQKNCPVLNPVTLNKQPKAYALWADEEIRAVSSSGGFFSVLAQSVLKDGGVVFGAAYSDDYRYVHHICATTPEELGRLRGSKYVHSNTEETYTAVEAYLKAGRQVLYTGCACQIAGLYGFLGGDRPNLLTADIVCHGAPSLKAYRAFLDEKSAGKTIDKVDFREKAYWKWGTAPSIFFSDGSVYRENDKGSYFKGFLGGIITRECCGSCPYAKINRVGDFTMGDFWGVDQVDPEITDKNGTSLALFNSPKGEAYFKQIKQSCTLAKREDVKQILEVAKTRNGQLLHSTRNHNNRAVFFEQLDKMSFSEAINLALTKYRYDIGYVGWWDSKNYGSALTCFALNRTLKNMGYSVLMLEHPGIKPKDHYDSYGIDFARHFYECSKITAEKNFDRFNGVCESFVVGSDQLWNWWCNKDIGFRYYFLDFVNGSHRKVSYATSFGSDWTSYPEGMRISISYFINRFDAVSVREKSGVDICRRDFNADATWVLDPVFLCDMASYKEVIALSKKSETEPYLYSYILDPTEDKIKAVRFMAEKKGLPYRIAIDGLGQQEKLYKLLQDDPCIISELRIEDWLYYISNAEFVLTDSFHGFCFSLIFHKQAIGYVNAHRGKARFDSIGELADVEERIVESFEQLKQRELWTKAIDYTRVEEKLVPMREFSRNWLKNALTARRNAPSSKELQLWKTLEHDRKIYEQAEEIKRLRQLVEQQGAEIKKLLDQH